VLKTLPRRCCGAELWSSQLWRAAFCRCSRIAGQPPQLPPQRDMSLGLILVDSEGQVPCPSNSQPWRRPGRGPVSLPLYDFSGVAHQRSMFVASYSTWGILVALLVLGLAML